MRRFPNSYLSLRACFDLLFTVLLLANQFNTCDCHRVAAFLSQFAFFGSLCCYLAIPLSLYGIITNPFADTSQPVMFSVSWMRCWLLRAHQLRALQFGIVVVSALSAILLIMTGDQGNGYGFCWVCYKKQSDGNMFSNPTRWLLVISPMLGVLLVR
jgi:hypothetical protein